MMRVRDPNQGLRSERARWRKRDLVRRRRGLGASLEGLTPSGSSASGIWRHPTSHTSLDRMIDGAQPRAFREDPAVEEVGDAAVEGDVLDLDEGGGCWGSRSAGACGQARGVSSKRAELDGLVDLDFEGDDPRGDLVEAGKDRDWILDMCLRSRRYRAEQTRRRRT